MKNHVFITSNLVPKVPLIILSIAGVLVLYALYILSGPEGIPRSTAMATVALCLITGLYAWLTNRLVKANQQQLEELRRSTLETRLSRTMIFLFLAERIRGALNELPVHLGEPDFDKKIREGILWRPEDLRELEQLGAHLGPWVAMPLVRIVNHLLWISRRVNEVCEVPTGTGFNYKKFPSEKWGIARGESSRDIDIVVGIARGQIDQFLSENKRGSDKNQEQPS